MSTKTYNYCGCFMHRVFLGLVAPYNEQCPAICGTDIDIVGIYQGDPVADGWYLRQGAGASAEVAEIVYIESDTITESRVCDSRIADYGHPNGVNSGYESPHYYNSGGDWLPMLEVGLKDLGSNDYEFKIWGVDPFPYDIAGSTILVQYSTDGGTNEDSRPIFSR